MVLSVTSQHSLYKCAITEIKYLLSNVCSLLYDSSIISFSYFDLATEAEEESNL